MLSLSFTLWLFVVLFAIIGAMRGWAKEVLVSSSFLLGLFILELLERYISPFSDFLANSSDTGPFWVQIAVISVLVFFGYQTPRIAGVIGARVAREHIRDMLLGLFFGAVNGFLIVSTLWYFLEQAGYPYPQFISSPNPANAFSSSSLNLLPYLAPNWLGIPNIFFAIAVYFLIVIIVFL